MADRHRFASCDFIQLSAFYEVHAEVAGTIAFADFVDGNNTRMVQMSGGLRFPSKALEMRVSGPMAQADHFKRHRAVKAFLPRAINHALTATADFFQQFVVTEI